MPTKNAERRNEGHFNTFQPQHADLDARALKGLHTSFLQYLLSTMLSTLKKHGSQKIPFD